jgi:hypothetical protein
MIEDFNLVVKLLLERFPELRGPVRESLGSYYDLERETPGAYPVFEDVVQEQVVKHLERNEDAAFLAKIFGFFEEMAGSSSRCVTDLLGITILDELVISRQGLARAWQYMGVKTRELTSEIASTTGHAENIPALTYEEVPSISHEELEQALSGSAPVRDAAVALYRMALNDPDWVWAEQKCIASIHDSRYPVQAAAVTCLGHLARIHGKTTKEIVLPELERLRSHPKLKGIAEDALTDISLFVT